MSLFERLKADQLEHRKAGSRNDAATLGTVIAESSKNDKNPSDEAVIKTLRVFLSNLDEYLKIRPEDEDAKGEVQLLKQYVPQMLSRDDLKAFVVLECGDLAWDLKLMRTYKERLDTKIPSMYDGKQLSEIIKELAAR